MFGDELLPKQRIADLADIGHQSIEYVVRQAILEFVDQAAYRADRLRAAADLDLRLGLRRIPIRI